MNNYRYCPPRSIKPIGKVLKGELSLFAWRAPLPGPKILALFNYLKFWSGPEITVKARTIKDNAHFHPPPQGRRTLCAPFTLRAHPRLLFRLTAPPTPPHLPPGSSDFRPSCSQFAFLFILQSAVLRFLCVRDAFLITFFTIPIFFLLPQLLSSVFHIFFVSRQCHKYFS